MSNSRAPGVALGLLVALGGVIAAVAQTPGGLLLGVGAPPSATHSVFDTTVTGAYTYTTTNAANDTATCSVGANCGSGSTWLAVGTTPKSAGKCYLEFKVTGSLRGFGLINASNKPFNAAQGTDLGAQTGAVGDALGTLNNNAGGSVSGYPNFTTGDTVGIAVDYTDSPARVWFRNDSAPNIWNAGAGSTPATPTTGVDISAIVSTGLYPAVNTGFFSNWLGPVVINTGQVAFAATAPSGYNACY